jgi:hypothetical protein
MGPFLETLAHPISNFLGLKLLLPPRSPQQCACFGRLRAKLNSR